MIAVAILFRPSQQPVTAGIERGAPAPEFQGMTLDGQPFDLADSRGRPVILNFWGQSCVPCREEFPLLKRMLAEHAADGLEVIGILTDDPPAGAKAFIRDQGATWPTVDDPQKTIKALYRVVGRPQSYFIDRAGILREIQVGAIPDEGVFERLYARIAAPVPAPTVAP